ncbi:hypothetical protein EUTSA_v10013151mg [Eutrema salsugineum]|uniref:Tify domain-containing protein n=2 Tax=Eutrema salsugineum TaxID=72664 RepID=V4KTN3_EUTSA|nr:hypothetical protein EUTSA_v10013151mg [Eutrema salsugineum]
MRPNLGRQDIEEIPYSGSSRMELKRSHQWLTEPSASELLSNKKQMVEIDCARAGFSTPHMNLSAWDNSLVPRQLTRCLFDPANAQHTSDLLSRNICPVIEEGTKYIEEQCNTVSSIDFPVVHTVRGSSFNLDTITKVKGNQVCESGNVPELMAQLYGEGISRSFETGLSYDSSQDGTLSFGQTCSNIDKSFILPGPFASNTDGNAIRNFNNEGVGVIPMGDIYDKGDENVFSTFHPFEKGVENFVLMGQSLQKADYNIFSTSPSSNKGQENFMSLLSCDKVPENCFMIESSYHKDNASVLSGRQSPYSEGGGMAFMVSSQDRADRNNDQISHEDRSKTISFGEYQKEPTLGSLVRVINSYENFSHASATAKDPLHMEAEETMSFEFGNTPYASPRVDTLLVPKSKDSKTAKKGSTNTFPSNVKSLLSTGMFDGVTVKYYSWSRERNLKGIIKGTGYLCGCGDCKLNKVLNAYEFEQHANCKTKHPNNHIYFENGKTIYGVVQELKNTPQEKLFDAIQNVTGSDINHKNFNTWKASYHVASLELQRIYGKDAVTLAS